MQNKNIETILGVVTVDNYNVDCNSATYTLRITLEPDTDNPVSSFSEQSYTPVPPSLKVVHVIQFNENTTFFTWLESPISETLHTLYMSQKTVSFYTTASEKNIHVQLPDELFTHIIPLDSQILI